LLALGRTRSACKQAAYGRGHRREFAPGTLRERPQRAFSKNEPHLDARLRVFFNDAARGDERVAGVVAFPCQHQHTGIGREGTDLLKIAQHRISDRAAGLLHRGPFARFVRAEKRGLEFFRFGAGEDGMRGDHGGKFRPL